MNKLLKIIKENDDGFENKFVNLDGHLDFIDEDGFSHLQKPTKIKYHIAQSRISELEALVEMIENKIDTVSTDYGEGYNQALSDIINEVKNIIKKLKI